MVPLGSSGLEQIELTGFIVQRRSLGKHLAFAKVMRDGLEGEEAVRERVMAHSDKDIVQVAFRRSSPSWNRDRDETFPEKSSSLPYGARVRLQLLWCETKEEGKEGGQMVRDQNARFKQTFCLEVHSWEMLVNPRDVAKDAAARDMGDAKSDYGGMSYSAYLKFRREVFLSMDKYRTQASASKESSSHPLKQTEYRERSNGTTDNRDVESPIEIVEQREWGHGDKKAKALRSRVFALWLLETFGDDNLREKGGVLDVAGGKGQLSVELSVAAGVPCTIVDPLLRRCGKGFPRREVKRIRRAHSPMPCHVPKIFDVDKFLRTVEGGLLVDEASCLVGLHPDECTEDILDVALRRGKPVAIVPCCVFPSLFPARRIRSCGTEVRTYDQFLQYLCEKDDRLKLSTLPFEGRNKVIFFTGS